MKKYLLPFLSLLLLPLGLNAMNAKIDKDINRLWDKYETARKADKPNDQLDILSEIKARASAQRQNYDFYRAVTLYERTALRVNWKQRKKLADGRKKEIADYDEPILSFINKRDYEGYAAIQELSNFLAKEKSRLQKARNSDIWKNYNIFLQFNELLSSTLENDYDYVLWSAFSYANMRFGISNMGDILSAMESSLAGKYPQYAFYEFFVLDSKTGDNKDALEAYEKKYSGKAVALLASQKLLLKEFAALPEETTSGEYKAFYEKCESFERQRSAFHGEEARIAGKIDGVSRLMERMKEKKAISSVYNGKLTLSLRNLGKCTVSIYDEKENEVYTKEIKNDKHSFYAWDTIETDMPLLDDGKYKLIVKDGKTKYDSSSFPKFTLSLAARNDGVYVADYESGKPLEKVDLHLLSGSTEEAVLHGFAIDAFTALPSDWLDKLHSDRKYRVYASCPAEDGSLRKSKELSNFLKLNGTSGWTEYSNVLILKDCAAFNPGQTVRFKLIGYTSSTNGKMSVVPAGTEYKVELKSPKDEVVKTLSLKANEYGSADGEFVLDKLPVHGWYDIVVKGRDGLNGSTRLLVDEYVLPTYTLTFDRNDKLYFSGDEVTVGGTLKAYSGHALTGAKVTYTVDIDGKKSEEKPVELAADGRFCISYMTAETVDYQHCALTVKVVDATGETLEFNDYKSVGSWFNLSVEVENEIEADLNIVSPKWSRTVLVEKNALVHFDIDNKGKVMPEVLVDYKVYKGNEILFGAQCKGGETVELPLAQLVDGVYRLEAVAVVKGESGKEHRTERSLNILKLSENATEVEADFTEYFRALDGMAVQMSAGKKDAWVVAELFDDKGISLKRETVHIPYSGNGKSTVYKFSYDYRPEYGEAVVLRLFYFIDGGSKSFSHVCTAPVNAKEMKVEFSRFTDNCLPGSKYTLSFVSDMAAEFAATVFDKATETFASNMWYKVSRHEKYVPEHRETTVMGAYGYGRPLYIRGTGRYDEAVPFSIANTSMPSFMESALPDEIYGARSSNVMMKSAIAAPESAAADMSVEEMETADVAVRENFATSLAFEPYLRADMDGGFSFEFAASDKLSAFVCALYGHDKEMNTVTERREFVVTMPVKVSAVQPQFLYEGDSYEFRATVANSGKAVKGRFVIYLYQNDDDKPCDIASEEIELGENTTGQLVLAVPAVAEGVKTLNFKAVFEGTTERGKISDGILVTVPVLPAKQTLVEAHSAVLLSEAEREAVMDSLRKAFVNVTAAGASFKESSLIDLLKAELKVSEVPEYQNVLSLMDALYCNVLGGSLVADNAEYKAAAAGIESMLAEYVNSDGGFAWMKGMKSSVLLSADVAERIAFLRDRGLANETLVGMAENAVKYIDRNQFDYVSLPYWCGYLSYSQYAFIRSLWSEVPFYGSVIAGKVQKENFAEFRTWASEWLAGKKRSAANGEVALKYQRLNILLSLLTSENGRALSKAWGVKYGSEKQLLKALAEEVASLNQYAVEHPSGAWYYPNLVMPYRGLLMSEAFCHSWACRTYYELANVRDEAMAKKIMKAVGAEEMAKAGRIADGVRLWIMIQKENQEWVNDAEYYNAIASVYDGSESLKAVKIISLSKKYEKAFEEIKAAGNGFSIEVKYYLDEVGPENEIRDGQVLRLGDKVVAQYNMWNEENRSFVRLNIPRPACLRPEEQLSGYPRWSFYRIGSLGFRFTPMAYREVRARYTDYWFDVLPEEKTVYTENFYVTQAGVFTLPVASIESLYAPHYRANDACHKPFISE